jgi:hypothetical protein
MIAHYIDAPGYRRAYAIVSFLLPAVLMISFAK